MTIAKNIIDRIEADARKIDVKSFKLDLFRLQKAYIHYMTSPGKAKIHELGEKFGLDKDEFKRFFASRDWSRKKRDYKISCENIDDLVSKNESLQKKQKESDNLFEKHAIELRNLQAKNLKKIEELADMFLRFSHKSMKVALDTVDGMSLLNGESSFDKESGGYSESAKVTSIRNMVTASKDAYREYRNITGQTTETVGVVDIYSDLLKDKLGAVGVDLDKED